VVKRIYNDSFYYSEDQISYFITNLISNEIVLYQDISSEWWQAARNNDAAIRKYITEKFARDFYPRVIAIRNKKFDLDYDLPYLRSHIIDSINKGLFSYQYEEEKIIEKTTQLLHSGVASIIKDIKKYNPRLAIKILI
jgi:hypothetical protein